MPTTPYAKILVSVNGAPTTFGGITVPSAATIALTPESTVDWTTSPLWEIYDYPAGFACPAGWSTAPSGSYISTAVTPPSFTLPSAATRWGKYMLRLTVNGKIVDEATALSMLSPKGQRDLGVREGAQFGGVNKQWVGELQALLRTFEPLLGGGGGSVPTGTGFRHVTAGVEDGASAKVNTTSAADVTVPATVNGVVTTDGSKLQQATNVLAGSGFISIGASPPAAGYLRLSGATSTDLMRFKYSGTDYNLLSLSAGAVLFYGSTSFDAQIDAYGLTLNAASGNLNLYAVGSLIALGTSGDWQIGKPQVGLNSAWGSVNGVGTQAMADANQTPAAAVYKNTAIATTGALTANRNLVLPDATDAQGYPKWINNQCTGAFGVVCKTSAGTTVTVANGKSAWVWFDSRGATRMTADV